MSLLTVGHGTLAAAAFVDLLTAAGVDLLVDVRRYPGSRRNPQFGRSALERSLLEAGIDYEHREELGGRRRAEPDSPNVGLRNEQFRGYADHMATSAFRDALTEVLERAQQRTAAVLCAESHWSRCHRRLLADAAVLLHGARVQHLDHSGEVRVHDPTVAARVDGSGDEARVVYDARPQPRLPGTGEP